MDRQIKVTGEYYRIDGPEHAGQRFETPSLALQAAYRYLAAQCVNAVKVQRVTTHDPVDAPDPALGPATERVTGEVVVPGPGHFMWSPELSRYHPNNGWVIPEMIEST